MKIHEYQAKAILKRHGVPVPRGEVASTAADAREIAHRLGGSVVVVKAQIHAGGRGKGGGVKLARSADDAERIARAVEGSRFPSSMPAEVERIDEEAALLRAADLIGQLGDPHYIRKANALYHEFEEAGLNRQLGYDSPADIVHKYPQFYWNSVAPYIQSAIRYLNVTANGRQWIANLHSNVFRAEREVNLSGPER